MDPGFKTLVKTELKKDNIPEHTFVMFYADWCGHCHSASGAWVKTYNEFNGKNGVLICAIESENAKKENPDIQGFPTFCYYFKGNHQKDKNFSGVARDLDGFKKWINGIIHSKKGGKRGGKTRVSRKNQSRRRTRKWLNLF